MFASCLCLWYFDRACHGACMSTLRTRTGFCLVGVVVFCVCDQKKGRRQKRYTVTIPRHRAVQQNTHRFSTPIRDADWSTQPRTGFWHPLLAVHRTAASQLGRHRFLTRPCFLSQNTPCGPTFYPWLFKAHSLSISVNFRPNMGTTSRSIYRTTRFHIPQFFLLLQSNHCNTPSAYSTNRCSTIHSSHHTYVARTPHVHV